MQKQFLPVALLMVCLSWPLTAPAQSAKELQRLEALDRKCLEARKKKLTVLQRQKVEECMKEPPPAHADPKTRGECEQYWSDYGWGAGKPGARSPRFFENIPECVAADKAHQQYRKPE